VPGIALVLAAVCLVAMVWFNLVIAGVFVAFMACGYLYFISTKTQRSNAPRDLMLEGE